MGVFELEPFAAGTVAVAKAVAAAECGSGDRARGPIRLPIAAPFRVGDQTEPVPDAGQSADGATPSPAAGDSDAEVTIDPSTSSLGQFDAQHLKLPETPQKPTSLQIDETQVGH